MHLEMRLLKSNAKLAIPLLRNFLNTLFNLNVSYINYHVSFFYTYPTVQTTKQKSSTNFSLDLTTPNISLVTSPEPKEYDDIVLQCSVDGFPYNTTTIHLLKGGITIQQRAMIHGTTDYLFRLQNVSRLDSDGYLCRVQNGFMTKLSKTMNLTINCK